jgi:hypothetical protein
MQDAMSQPTPQRPSRSLRQRARKLIWLTEAQAALGWGIIIILVALLGAIYLTQTSRIAATGRRVQLLQGDLTDIKRENATLERQVAEAQALPLLQQRAAALGFMPARPENIEYLVVPDYPTGPPPITTPPPEVIPTPEPIETIQEALWYAVKDYIAGLIQGESSER